MKNNKKLIIAVLLIVFSILILAFLKLPSHNNFWREFNNSGHAPLFALISIGIFIIVERFFNKRKITSHFLITFFAGILIGIAAEAVQIISARDASLYDFYLDFIGVISGLLLIASYKLSKVNKQNKKLIRLSYLSCFLILLIAYLPPIYFGIAVLYQKNNMPNLCSFDTHFGSVFVEGSRAEMKIVDPPKEWSKNRKVAELTVSRRGYSGMTLNEPYPIWEGYDSLVFEAFSDRDDSVVFAIRVDDFHHNNQYEDRFTEAFYIKKGNNRFSFPIDQIKNAPAGREMDLTQISVIIISTIHPPEPITVYFDKFQLIKNN